MKEVLKICRSFESLNKKKEHNEYLQIPYTENIKYQTWKH